MDRAEMDEMNADFEELDAAEYAQFNAEQDARDSERDQH